jgi:hypothetical protein
MRHRFSVQGGAIFVTGLAKRTKWPKPADVDERRMRGHSSKIKPAPRKPKSGWAALRRMRRWQRRQRRMKAARVEWMWGRKNGVDSQQTKG